ncbi:MAG: hypothetical protein HYS70_02945 [Nitrospinae bacterium]|nr:hypothetical protein [Nitrospinota bacterium]
MVDGDALRQAFGTTLDDGKLGVPAGPHEVEKIVDPKQALDQAFRQVVGRQRRRKKSAADFLDVIGERVRLPRLRLVPAFKQFERELHHALRKLGYLKEEAT